MENYKHKLERIYQKNNNISVDPTDPEIFQKSISMFSRYGSRKNKFHTEIF